MGHKMRGGIVNRAEEGKPARYYVVMRVADPDTGRRRQKWVGPFKTRREAEAEQARAKHTAAKGGDPFPADMNVGEYFARWLGQHEHRVRPRTWHRYAELVDNHVLPTLRDLELRRVRPAHVREVLEKMRAAGRAPATVVQARA